MGSRVFLNVFVGLIFLFMVAPIVAVAVSSVSGGAMFVFPPASFTLDWYSQIPLVYFQALLISLEVGIGATAIAVVVGMPAGLALVRGRLPGSRALSAFCLMPLTIPSLVIGVAGLQFLNTVYDLFHIALAESVLGLTLAHSALTIPFVVRAVVAGQVQMNGDLENAAMNLGAAPVRVFWTVTLPTLRPAVIAGAIAAFLISFDDVPIALFLGGGDVTTLPVRIFNSLQFDLSPAILALSTIVAGSIILLIALCSKVFGLDRAFGTVKS
ncbi:MAG TPA: ABC transporter permease [Alphaproteobacteria bacterium]|nr:ABC transporter permease [Alphaproteobacteria bacterium]